MSLFESWSAAFENRNADAAAACLHDDFTFVRHQSGTTMNKAEMLEMFKGFLSNDSVVMHSQRCLYENAEIMVEHSVMDFPDGSREAIMSFNTLKDGQIVRTETGATPISK